MRQSLELGIVEAVVTGGEPFLRRDLTLELVETLAEAGVGVTLNSNGWFVDEEVAARLGALRGVTAHVSLDGARPGLHDASRGVPGSWRRAVEGIDRLLGAGVGVCVVHVVTPDNAAAVPEFLEQMWVLGVPWVRVTPVVLTGAAARGGEWRVEHRALVAAVEEFHRSRGTAMRISLQAGTGGSVSLQGREAPGSFLVRPNGDVRPDSARPFSFGNAVRDGVEACWQALREGWDDERINRWAAAMKRPEDLPKSELIAYVDEEISVVDGSSGSTVLSARSAKLPAPTPPKPADPELELKKARTKVRKLAGARRYRLAPLRASGSPDQRFVRLAMDGRYLRLNESGSVVMDTLDGGTLDEATVALADRNGLDPEHAREDAIAATRDLVRRRVVLATKAGDFFPVEPGTSDLPGLEPSG